MSEIDDAIDIAENEQGEELGSKARAELNKLRGDLYHLRMAPRVDGKRNADLKKRLLAKLDVLERRVARIEAVLSAGVSGEQG